jgi:hypothetical protein
MATGCSTCCERWLCLIACEEVNDALNRAEAEYVAAHDRPGDSPAPAAAMIVIREQEDDNEREIGTAV